MSSVMNNIEFLRLVFSFLKPHQDGVEGGDETKVRKLALSSAARTCRAFKDLALSSLWWKLDGLDAVLVAARGILGQSVSLELSLG